MPRHTAAAAAAAASALLVSLLLAASASASASTTLAFVPPGPNPASATAPAPPVPSNAPTAGSPTGAAPSSPATVGASAANAASSPPLTRMAASVSQPKQNKKKKRGGSASEAKGLKTMKAPPPNAERADFGVGAPSSELVGGSREREAAVAEAEELSIHLGEEHNAALQIRRMRSLGKWPVLVLNADCQPLSFLPLSVMRWQDAIKAIWLERVTVLEYYNSFIQSSRGPWQLPSVICLKEYQKTRREHVALNRRNIYLRDRYECAFCLTRLRSVDLSLDHVHPRCKGGKSTWDNLVTCCKTCNRRKGQKSLKEIQQLGMTLMKPPRRPTMSELQGIARHFRTSHGSVHETWQPYLGMKPADE